ncbi:MAG: hypothetical protein HY906_09780 [Deltaproteobacteria bacterium]|nr:hypothetical protein [Deltaproteobacteria bacterium]
MRPRFALLVLVLAAGSLAAAAFAGAQRARTVARERATERHLVAARGAAALCEVYLDTLADTVRAAARGFAASPEPAEQRLRALYERSEHFRIVSVVDEEGRSLRPPVHRDAAAAAIGPAAAGTAHGSAAGGTAAGDAALRRHPTVGSAELDEHLRAVPVDDARRGGFALSAPFMRGDRGPFVVLAASYQVGGESHPTGDPCHPGSRHVIAAEIALDWLVARLRVATGGPHEVLLLDDQYRVLGGVAPFAKVGGLGPVRSPQAVAVELPGQAAAGLGPEPALGALAPVPRYGWSVLVRAPRWRVVPVMSSLSIVWAAASLVVLLGAAVALARRAPGSTSDPGA